MKNIILGFATMLLCAGCMNRDSLPEVHVQWFNLSANEIWVTGVVGLPRAATPGGLMPSHGENQLETKETVFSEPLRVEDSIIIKWLDYGTNSLPGDLEIPGRIPPGMERKLELRREDLGIPAKLETGRIRFTYQGEDKWRVRALKPAEK